GSPELPHKLLVRESRPHPAVQGAKEREGAVAGATLAAMGHSHVAHSSGPVGSSLMPRTSVSFASGRALIQSWHARTAHHLGECSRAPAPAEQLLLPAPAVALSNRY